MIEGMAAIRIRIILNGSFIRWGEYSARNKEPPRPNGIAIRRLNPVTQSVLMMKTKMPYCWVTVGSQMGPNNAGPNTRIDGRASAHTSMKMNTITKDVIIAAKRRNVRPTRSRVEAPKSIFRQLRRAMLNASRFRHDVRVENLMLVTVKY
jgi:hypothetical protein